jgi:CBS domain-containing protein
VTPARQQQETVMNVGHICSRHVDSARGDETAQAAAARMLQRNVGSLVVLDAQGRPQGIVTDRDLTVQVVARGRAAGDTWVSEIMTRQPLTVGEEQPIEFALGVMRQSKCRRLPVVDQDRKVIGVVSLDDVLRHLVTEFGLVEGLLQGALPAATTPA